MKKWTQMLLCAAASIALADLPGAVTNTEIRSMMGIWDSTTPGTHNFFALTGTVHTILSSATEKTPAASFIVDDGELLIPVFNRTPSPVALHQGDRIFASFITDNGVKARKFDIAAVYQTNMTKFDELLCFTDLYTTRRLNGWEDTDIYSGAEMTVSDFSLTDVISSDVAQQLQMINATIDNSLHTMSTKTIFEAYPQIFTWLELLDLNVWIILALMVCVAGFTMISGLLIIILERTRMIGILKALGARNKTIRHTFLWFAAFIIGQGLFWGNLIGVGIVLLQQHFSLITLDPATYYVKEAPMELNLPVIVALNVATMAISIFVLIAPSYLISFIHPAKSMRYE